MSTPLRPLFLSLDGIDGTGKSTQVKLLAERLRSNGHAVTTCTDPGGTELGAKIREILLHGKQQCMSMRAEALLFMASRAELIERVIAPALDRGEIVISDRFLLANVVYQGHAGGLDVNDLWSLGTFVTKGIEPDLTLILDLPVEAARSRRPGPADRLERRTQEYFEQVRAGFLAEATLCPQSRFVVDASGSIEAVHEALFQHVQAWLGGRR
jgi:dTMP kinase